MGCAFDAERRKISSGAIPPVWDPYPIVMMTAEAFQQEEERRAPKPQLKARPTSIGVVMPNRRRQVLLLLLRIHLERNHVPKSHKNQHHRLIG